MSYDIGLKMMLDTGGAEPFEVRLGAWNYTHNCWRMFDLAGVRGVLKSDGTMLAADALPILARGVLRMEADPDAYRALNPQNGWGSYDGALAFVRAILDGCRAHPKATVWTGY